MNDDQNKQTGDETKAQGQTELRGQAQSPNGNGGKPQKINAFEAQAARIAELEAQLAAAQVKPAASAKVASRVPLTKMNAGEGVKARLKHGTFVGATADGKVFDHDNLAKMDDVLILPRAYAYRMADVGTFELV